jgi:hypothetical protein
VRTIGSTALRLAPVITATLLLGFGGGCKDNDKQSIEKSRFIVDQLVPIIEEDAAQLKRGMPEGAKKLGENLPEDPADDLRALQQALKRSRDAVDDLRFAKGTFFAFANPEGVVLRSEDDPDRLANANVFSAFPELKKALDGESVVESFGEMAEIRGVKTGDDVAWVVAHGVPAKAAKEGAPAKEGAAGVFVSGWSFRAYAQYLENQAKRALKEKAEESSDRTPLFYVFLVRANESGGETAYGTPTAPDVNAEAIAKQGIVEKTASGPYEATVEITDRKFGLAATRIPALGEGAAVAALSSVF